MNEGVQHRSVDVREEFAQKRRVVFGWHVVLDLVECNDNIFDAAKIKEYAERLCEVLKMKKYGEALIPYFGVESEITKGHSLVQLIETSAIMGHFSEYYRSAHIDIFSCKAYDQKEAMRFTQDFFGGKISKCDFIVRHCE
jgi:S-adenosylmethionine decarboxylase